MMSHIIYLLLIASSPIYTLGDGSGSWGSFSSGPSESECRPYIEKALQGAAVQDPPPSDQPTTIDDVGDTGQGEENLAPSETSETLASETPSDGEGAGESEVENQQESVATEEHESTEEQSGEAPLEHEEDNTESSGETKKESEETEASTEIPTETTEESEEAPTETASNEEEEHQPEESNEEKNTEITEESVDNESEEALKETSADESNQENEANADDATSAQEGDESLEVTAESDDKLESKEETESKEEVLTEGNETVEEPSAEEGTIEEKSDEETPNEEPAEEQSIEEPDTSNEEIAPSSLDSKEEPDNVSEDETVQKETEEIETSGEKGEESKEISEPIESIDKESELTSDEATENTLEESSQSEEAKEEDSIVKEVESQEEVPAEETSNEANEENLGEVPSDEPVPTEETAPESVQPEPASEEQPEAAEGQSEEATEQAGDAEKQPESVEEPSEEIAPEKEESTETEETPSEGEAPETEPPAPEEELTMILDIPENLRSRDHMAEILRLNEENEETEKLLGKTIESTLRDLKKLYDAAIKPLEILYKYRDLSNRHFGDPEIFSKPLILFMGPWSGGKSTIINYLLENEYKHTALRSGAEPSPAYFNIVMWGDREEVLDGTQLAADWTFSGLQKFGQGLLDRLRGLRLNHPLLQKVNIVEIPGILEIRKQVERLFPFNDACQWFIDRADIIFLVYDPSKLDVGPETEAILDQLKGREMQTRIILNKADQVKPEELMRVQGTLIWNISPLMSSTEPPVLYSTSLWSLPYEVGAPARLLYAQERLFLKDLRDAIDKRVENKIASARRFAVRVRNHAKMVDCYLTTYYNHKSFFGNKKKISDDIIEHPQNYHIYEGLSTLTNISRYDLPDPDVYRDFFRLNPVYEFQQLASTCTYFRGCPINRLDVAIAYDLPELVGRYKKQVEEVLKSITK